MYILIDFVMICLSFPHFPSLSLTSHKIPYHNIPRLSSCMIDLEWWLALDESGQTWHLITYLYWQKKCRQREATLYLDIPSNLPSSPSHDPTAASSWPVRTFLYSSRACPGPASEFARRQRWLPIWAFLSSSQARLEHRRHKVFPVPVGLSNIAFWPCNCKTLYHHMH